MNDDEIEELGFDIMNDDEVFIVVEEKNFVTQIKKRGGWNRKKTFKMHLHH